MPSTVLGKSACLDRYSLRVMAAHGLIMIISDASPLTHTVFRSIADWYGWVMPCLVSPLLPYFVLPSLVLSYRVLSCLFLSDLVVYTRLLGGLMLAVYLKYPHLLDEEPGLGDLKTTPPRRDDYVRFY